MSSSSSSFQFNRKQALGNVAAAASAARRALLPCVLHLVPDLQQTPEARQIVDFAVQVNRAGWRGVIASSGGPLVVEAERAAVRHTLAPIHSKALFSRWRSRVKAETLVQIERPVLVHAHGFQTMRLALGLMKTRRLPVLVDLTEPGDVTKSLQKIMGHLAVRGARFRVPSEYMARHLREDFGLHTEFLYIVPPGVDLGWFDAGRVTPERLHRLAKLWRLPEGAPVVVMTMPLAPGYGHEEMLQALTTSAQKKAYVVMIGEDEKSSGMREKMERRVSELELEGRVLLPESCDDWPAACWLSSVVVALNTVPRGQGMELLGAQAIGRPVIVTACGSNAEMVQSGETAWVIPPDNKEALQRSLDEAFSMSPAQSIDLAQRTREFIAGYFPQDVWIESILEIYTAMLSVPMMEGEGK